MEKRLKYLDKDTLKKIGERCLHIREDYNEDRILSQREFATKLGITHSRVCLIEAGKAEMTLKELHAYQKISGYSFDYFMGKSECKKADNDEINKRLGLNDKAINFMEMHRNDNFDDDVINFLFTSENFWIFTNELKEYRYRLPLTIALSKNPKLLNSVILLTEKDLKEAENAGNTKKVLELKKQYDTLKTMLTYNKSQINPTKIEQVSLFEISEVAKEIAKEYRKQNDSTNGKKKI